MKRRNTASKQSVLDILRASKKALSQENIEQEVKGTMDRVTVYRALNSFCEDGLVHKVLSDDGKFYFAICVKCEEKKHTHNHFHFRCVKCQTVECLKEEVNFRIPRGYKVQDVNCMLTGYCRDCA
ncbi:transcriptional regulator [Sphingobacteriaceae bacterium]|nr:transcriptional regulator [Sphingobacteriaceae bacterium]